LDHCLFAFFIHPDDLPGKKRPDQPAFYCRLTEVAKGSFVQ
jgi:hypothetical protein